MSVKEFDILCNNDLKCFCQTCIYDTFPFSHITDAEVLEEVNLGNQTSQKAHRPDFGSLDTVRKKAKFLHVTFTRHIQKATFFFSFTPEYT